MTIRGFLPADVSNLVGKVYPSAEVLKTIRIAASAVMDGWLTLHGLCHKCKITCGELGECQELN
jgi:hypothetical protein